MKNTGLRKKLTRSALSGTFAAVIAATALMIPAAPAQAAIFPISGSTSWGPCTWFTSNNLRFTTVASKQVRANLSSTGKLGVQMRSRNENTGVVSATRFYPPLNTWQNLGFYSASGTPFRLQFTCVNERNWWERPSTDFQGSLDY